MNTHSTTSNEGWKAEDGGMSPALKSLLATRLRLTAQLQAQMAAALTGKGQDELRKHFNESADLLLEAARALTVVQS